MKKANLSRNKLIWLAFLLVMPHCGGAAQNLIGNGGFETPIVTNPNGYQTYGITEYPPPPGFVWTLADTTINHVRLLWQHAEGEQSVNLNGNGPGLIQQNVATVPGRRYAIRFAYAGVPESPPVTKSFTVSWGGSQLALLQGDDEIWQYYYTEITATSTSTQLRFASTTPGTFYGPTIDDVSVTEFPTVWVEALDNVAREDQVHPSNPADKGRFRISRSGGLDSPLAVHFTTSGTAIRSPSMDYSLALVGGSGVWSPVTIPAGSSSILIDVYAWWDFGSDPWETAIMTLSQNPAYLIVEPSSATVFITDP